MGRGNGIHAASTMPLSNYKRMLPGLVGFGARSDLSTSEIPSGRELEHEREPGKGSNRKGCASCRLHAIL
jgi:hypothetical protein